MKKLTLSPRTIRLPMMFSATAVIAFSQLVTPSSHSQTTVASADFTGGGSTTSPITNQVDAWTGQAGDGWLTAWSPAVNADNTTLSAQVLNTAPLTPDENYLQFSVTNTNATNVRAGTVRRRYDSSVSLEQTISFQFRIDSDRASTVERIRIFDGQSASLTEAGNTVSWFIRTQASTWRVYDGTTVVNTGMAAVTGNIYNFNIHVVNDTYVVSISDLTAGTNYTSGTLNFFSDSATTVGGYLHFSQAVLANTTSTASLGNIQVNVIPEPNTTSMAALGLLLLFRRNLFLRLRNNP